MISNNFDALLIGIGNSGRGDDGLGWAFLEALEQKQCFKGQIHYRYQLAVEDAELISHAKEVVFVDAFAQPLANGFDWRPCLPTPDFAFTSHIIPPQALLYLCADLYDKHPSAHLLLIQGHCWELEQGLSGMAQQSLEAALRFFDGILSQKIYA